MEESKFTLERLENLSSFIPNHKGYKLNEIIAIELALILNGNEKISLSTFGKFILKFDFANLDLDKPLFFTIGKHNRKDYKEIMDFVIRKFPKKKISFFNFQNSSFNVAFNLKSIVLSFKTAFSIKQLGFKGRFLLASKLCFYKNSINALESINKPIKTEKAVLFSSVHPWEAMFLYFFKNRNKPVYALQHGVYFVYKQTFPIDSILYKNFNADYHLCWGSYTKKEFVEYGIKEDRLLVSGYPRQVLTQIVKKEESNKCIVLLARKIFHESNKALIQILKIYSEKEKIEFYFKLHPSLVITDYEYLLDFKNFNIVENNCTLKEVFESGHYSKAICVYTTAYYEAYLSGILALRYYDGKSELSEGIQDDVFGSLNDLYRVFKTTLDSNEVEEKLKYLLGFNIDNYYEILN